MSKHAKATIVFYRYCKERGSLSTSDYFLLFKNIFCSVFSFAVILEKTIRIPRSLSVKASSVLKGFLNKNPADRLGCRKETGFVDIIHHPFFKSVDWEMVKSRSWHCLNFISSHLYGATAVGEETSSTALRPSTWFWSWFGPLSARVYRWTRPTDAWRPVSSLDNV